MAWQTIGTVSIRAADSVVRVGAVSVPADGTLEIRVKQISPTETSVFRSGLMYVTTAQGRTLGSRKFWGHREGEDYVLGGPGYSAGLRDGELWIEPRAFNRRVLKIPILSPWVLEVSADVGVELPADRVTSPGFIDSLNRALRLVAVGTQGRIGF